MKIGSLTPLWNQEPYIIPHFKMLSKLDKNVVLRATKPLPDYQGEHGYEEKEDRTFELLKKFPNVEIYDSTYYGKFGAGLYNEGIKYVQDCDIVFRLDPDMLMFEEDWDKWIDFIKSHPEYDCYRVNFSKRTINYYLDFDHGLQDAKEYDVLAFKPDKLFEEVLYYEAKNLYILDWEDWMIHHFRGWNKPKSVTKDWPRSDFAKMGLLLYGNNGDWFHCPQRIRDMMDKESVNSWFQRAGLDTL